MPRDCVPPESEGSVEQKFYELLDKFEKMRQRQGDPKGGGRTDPQQGGSKGKKPPPSGGGGSASDDALLQQLAQTEALHGLVKELLKDDGTELSESEWRAEDAKLRGTLQAAIAEAKRRGQMPAGLEQDFLNRLKPRIPWTDVLARFVGGFNREDYSYRRLARRAASPVILPGLHNPEPAKVPLAPDTSGSMYGGPLERVCAELFAVAGLYTHDPEIDVLWWDAAVYHQKIQEPEELKPQGGGGTSTNALFAYLRDEMDDAQGVIVLTDGYIYSYGKEPPAQVLWIVVGDNKDFAPPFGEVAYFVEEDDD